MSKVIAFCADGTWDKASTHTNVYKLFKSLIVSSSQMPFYDDGVGADGNPITKLLGGAFGVGLWQKIKEGYTKIAHVYEAGDSLFLFGFSRGAFTARSLAGMIAACGLPTKNFTQDLVNTAFDAYRNKANRAQLLAKLADSEMHDAKITMVGVWDTVGALGIPSFLGGVDPIHYGFLDTGLHPDVLNAYQALAIDEMRREFPPTLWTSPPAPGQNLEQVWFCGVHSDVGGGEPDASDGGTALSDITLTWMIDKAIALGLQIDPGIAKQYALLLDSQYALNRLHTSWSPLCGIPKRRSIDRTASVANSVLARYQSDSSWRPENLNFVGGTLAPEYRVVEVVVHRTGAAA
ncbi:MAG: DUF2235 domain-containing protein [Acidobacteriaceae bacterium]|nr:DUF2235 domain-containing protein [Acidobacteriaceae bacterium]